MTEIRIELRELNGRGTLVWDNLTLEPKGVRFYDGVRRLPDSAIASGNITVAIDYVPEDNAGGALALVAAYFAEAATREIADAKVIRIPDETDVPMTVKGNLELLPRKNEKGYVLRGLIWKG